MHKKFVQAVTAPASAYELIDSGDGMKLERYGSYVLARPDPQVLWRKRVDEKQWIEADASFHASWKMRKDMPDSWDISYNGLTFNVRPSAFKHTGIFPEHAPSWNYMKELIIKHKAADKNASVKVLNLFGYTGGATLACAQAGAEVAHVDASQPSVDAAVKNSEISGLREKPIRWIVDDAHAFVKRELRREQKYDGIVMDPPSFGRGPSGEVWKVEEHLLDLLDDTVRLLSDKPLFFILNGYAAGYAPEAYVQAVESAIRAIRPDLATDKVIIEYGNLQIQENGSNPRLLPAGVFARVQFA